MKTPMKLIACVEPFEDAGYLAWIDHESFKGLIVQAQTAKDALRELLISLKAKIAFDYGIDFSSIVEKEINSQEELEALKGVHEKEINLTLA